MSSKRILSLIFFISLLSINNTVNAADINAGEIKSKACLGCHGADGNSKSPSFPILAGQRALYIESQLKAFQTAKRTSSVMKNMVSKLSTEDIQDISLYFSSQTTESAGADPSLAEKGKDRFSMCMGCHGSSAQGRGGFPKLAGQQPEYLKKQLLNFKTGSRKGGPMNAITSSLSEQDINEIAAYLGSL